MSHSNFSFLIICCLIQVSILAASFTPAAKEPDFPDFNPFAEEGIFSLNHKDAYNLVYRCKIRPSEELEYWILSENLIRLVDKRLKAFLKKNKLSSPTKKVHKQFFGMKTDANHKFIYIFVYPKPSSAAGKEQGNAILLCGNISKAYHKIEFDYKTLKFLKL
jgi:hypothetical protein